MSLSEILATATLEKRETDLGTSPRVVRLIPRRTGSISSLYGVKTNLKTKALFATSTKNVPHNGRFSPHQELNSRQNGPTARGKRAVWHFEPAVMHAIGLAILLNGEN